MTPRKLNIHAAFFCYAGNGGYAAILPDIAFWWAETLVKLRKDERIEKVTYKSYSDTPITLTRNVAVETARQLGADVLLLIDSDNKPDCEPDGKPFWESSFDFLYQHYEQGPVIVFAPYCGPPDYEVPYVFKWTNRENDAPLQFKLEMMSREEVTLWSGIQNVGAGPTGLMLIDMRICTEVIDPPYFQYGFNATHSEKNTTEDVFFTRNASLNGIVKLGYNPLFCNFDAWAGHAKQKMVRRPRAITADSVAETLRKAVLSGRQAGERLIEVGENANKDRNGVYVPPKPRFVPSELKAKVCPEPSAEDKERILKAIASGPIEPITRIDPCPLPAVHLRPGTQDALVVHEIVNQNSYKLPDKFPEGSVVLDVGAHIGIFALECVKRGAAKVICCEPELENFALLRANTRHDARILTMNVAVWTDHQPIELFVREGIHTAMHYCRPATNGSTIKSVTLDELVEGACQFFPRIHLLKLDCEGAEQGILETATCLDKIDHVAMEIHPGIVDRKVIEDILAANQFSIGSSVSAGDNWVLHCNRAKPSRIRSLVQELAYELGEKPNVVTIEPPDGTMAIELADAGAMVYTVRSELTQEFQDAAGQRLGDTIEVLAGEQWTRANKFMAPANAVIFAHHFSDFHGWMEKATHLICGTDFLKVQRLVKGLPGEFETDGDIWFKKIEQTVGA